MGWILVLVWLVPTLVGGMFRNAPGRVALAILGWLSFMAAIYSATSMSEWQQHPWDALNYEGPWQSPRHWLLLSAIFTTGAGLAGSRTSEKSSNTAPQAVLPNSGSDDVATVASAEDREREKEGQVRDETLRGRRRY